MNHLINRNCFRLTYNLLWHDAAKKLQLKAKFFPVELLYMFQRLKGIQPQQTQPILFRNGENFSTRKN